MLFAALVLSFYLKYNTTMGKRFIILLVCIFTALYAQAYEHNPYYNRPSNNSQVQADFSEYMNNLKSKLQKNWVTPDFLEDGHIRVLFKIDREGNVIAGDILESSGNPVFDESAINAIHKSEPFGKFPENSSRQTLTINYSFDTTFIKTDKIKIEISAGFTPLIRIACAIVVGLTSFSFCLASLAMLVILS